jgi:hypothetical protein
MIVDMIVRTFSDKTQPDYIRHRRMAADGRRFGLSDVTGLSTVTSANLLR